MHTLTTVTKIKLVMPFIYAMASIVFFVVSWPEVAKAYHILGASLVMIAFTAWIVARIQLGNAFTIAPDAKFIVENGIYSKLRHPVYYFSIMAGLGFCIYLWQWPWLIALVLFAALQLFRIRKEESLLIERFGQDYLEYKKSTWL